MLLHYLKASNSKNSKLQRKALDNITAGIQRVLTYQNSDGGFGLFCGQPSEAIYTAYAGLFFSDISKVMPVDAKITQKIIKWLMKRKSPEGFWETKGYIQKLGFTATVIYSLRSMGVSASKLSTSFSWLTREIAKDSNPYNLALALIAIPKKSLWPAKRIAKRLTTMRKQNHWLCMGQTLFQGYGATASITTTALAARGLLIHQVHPELAIDGIKYLQQQRGPRGDWGSTSATVEALKTIIYRQQNKQVKHAGFFTFDSNGSHSKLEVSDESFGVAHLVELGNCLKANENTLTIKYTSISGALPQYRIQVVSHHYLPWELVQQKNKINLSATYSKARLKIGEEVTAKATINYQGQKTSGMIMIDWGIPPGLQLKLVALKKLLQAKTISRYEVQGNRLIFYLPSMQPASHYTLTFPFIATTAIKGKTPTCFVYDYYNPDITNSTTPIELEVK